MAFKAFIDINILVDFLQPVRPFHQDAVELFFNLSGNNFNGFISESIITTAAYLIQKDFSILEINQLIEGLNQKLKILPCSNNLISIAASKNPVDFEDALLYEIASHHQLDYFITSNLKDFKKIQHTRLPVLRAKDFNKLLI